MDQEIELRHLRYFIAVAQELHFGRAAIRLNLSQPPLSQQIRRLEELLGYPLFVRTSRAVKLTSAGAVFLERAQRTLLKMDEDLQATRSVARGEAGSLTVGFIVQGIQKMCALEGRNLRRSTLLIVGATGDVGSGCARCLAPFVKRVLLSARNLERLRRLAAELEANGVQVEIATGQQQFSEADIVICAASLACPSLLLGRIAPGAIVCDAGYPKNLSPNAQMPDARIFFGGLGQITGGLRFTPDFHGVLNRHPFPDVVHGCLLEGMALALEGRFEPFSQGRGFITPRRVEEIETIAERHGIYLAPLYNADGPLEAALDLFVA